MRPRHLPLACAMSASALLAGVATPLAVSAAPAATPTTSSSTTVAAASTRPSQKDQLLYMINGERARAGVAPLSLRTGVADVAREWAATMAGDRVLRHRPDLGAALNRRGVSYRTAGEVVGSGGHVSDVHRGFMGSPSHRAILLSPSYSEVGVGVTASGGVVWVTVDFVGQ